ncbi:MAG: hypothetical protein AABX79_02420 [Nanoarchaeota archaeon]
MNNMRFDASFFLRVGLAFVFIYAAVSGFLDPQSWIGYVPHFIGNDVMRGYFLFANGVVEIFLGLWLLSGKKTFYSGIVSALLLAGIAIANLGSFIVVFRDVGLFFAAVALAVLSKKEE